MPQYAFSIDGRRHLFEGPDPQTTAQFAQRWAAAQPSARAPVAANDNRPQVAPQRSQFAMDIGARAKQDVADLTGAIDQVRAHPTSLLNGPRILSAVSRYIPNAFGLVPAAGVDQATGPIVRGINSRIGTHFDPRYATDQILNAAGALTGAGEMPAAERFLLPRTVEKAFPQRLLSGPEISAAQHLLPGTRESPRLTTHIGNQPQLAAPRARPELTVAYEAPELGDHLLGQNSAGENVVPLSEGFRFNHEQRMKSLEDLPPHIQEMYRSAIDERIIDPLLDDPDYGGHNSTEVEEIRDELAQMAAEQRGEGGNARLADALDAANEDFRVMVNQQQPEMAKELGLTRPGDAVPASYSSSEPDANQTGARGELASFEQHAEPPEELLGAPDDQADIVNSFHDLVGKWPAERIAAMLKAWKDIRDTANDNAHLPDWAGRVKSQKPPILPTPEDFEPPTPLRDTMSPEEKEAWMKTAANDNGVWDSEEYREPYLPRVWGAPRAQLPAVWEAPRTQLPAVWAPPRAQLPVVSPRPTNAFSGPTTLEWTTVPRPPRQGNSFDFNALRPPPWLGPLLVGAANQPRYSEQPEN